MQNNDIFLDSSALEGDQKVAQLAAELFTTADHHLGLDGHQLGQRPAGRLGPVSVNVELAVALHGEVVGPQMIEDIVPELKIGCLPN